MKKSYLVTVHVYGMEKSPISVRNYDDNFVRQNKSELHHEKGVFEHAASLMTDQPTHLDHLRALAPFPMRGLGSIDVA